MGTKVLEKTFTLPNKKVTVRYIKRKKGMAAGVADDHVISGGMLNGAVRKYCTPKQRNKALANPLTKAEKNFLESEKGLDKKLSVFSNRDFWIDRYVSLVKGDNILDLNDPIDYIDYKILLANKDKIAPSLSTMNNKATYEFVVIDEDEEREIEKNTFNYKKEAFKLYSKVESNKEILRGILKIINKKPISDKTSIEWLQQEVEKIVDVSPKSFVNLLKDSNYEYKILLTQAEDAGVIINHNQRYSTEDGISLSEQGEVASFDNAVKYLASPKNQELVDIIRIKLKNEE